jgi:hypothetical protein
MISKPHYYLRGHGLTQLQYILTVALPIVYDKRSLLTVLFCNVLLFW